MGAGAGAATAIDNNEPSPRGSAIEKAQAELRRDLAVREERRRELEFLEKGGEPLDFKFGEAPPTPFSSLSPTEPLAGHLLKSEGEGGYTGNVVANGGPSNLKQEYVGGGAENADDLEISAASKNGTGSSHFGSRLTGPNSRLVDPPVTLDDSTAKKDSESSGRGHAASKSQAIVKRNRVRSQRLGNGHTPLKEIEKVPGAGTSIVESESKVPSVDVENEAMVDMSYQVLPHQSSLALPSKWTGLNTSQEFDPVNEFMVRCGPVLEQHPTDPISKDRATLPSQRSVQSADVRVDSRVDSVERELDSSSVVSEVCHFELVDGLSAHVQKVGELGEADSLARGHVEVSSTLEVAPLNPTRIWEEEGVAANHPEIQPRLERRERVGHFVSSMDKVSDRSHKVGVGLEGLSCAHMHENKIEARTAEGTNMLHTGTDVMGGVTTNRNAGMLKKALTSKGGSLWKGATKDRSGQDEKRAGVHHVRIKFEDGVADDRARPSATDAEPGCLQSNGAPNSQDELRSERQAGAVVGVVPKTISRSSSLSALFNCKHPGVVLPWEKEQDPVVQAEMEKHKADLQERANKAREDFILEEAEHLKAKRKLIEDWKSMRKSSEPLKRKSHWDFVLEEMKWLANDVYQERLWKRAHAAHICRTISIKKCQDEFLASELNRRQRKLASFLASAVNGFWHKAEAGLIKEKTVPPSIAKVDKSESEAVPMDVDIPAVKEVSEKSLQPEKPAKEIPSSIQRYAVQFLKASGFEKSGLAEAPATPDRYWERNGCLGLFWEDKFSEEPLFYVVPDGSMEAYRRSVESDWARAEQEYEEKRAVAAAEVELLVAAEDATMGPDFGFADFFNDGGSQEDELQTDFMSEGGHSRISKKKRKKIFKTTNAGPKMDGSGLQGFPYRSAGLSTSELAPVITGKRSLAGGLGPNTVPGSIPVKRARSSAANLRPRATHLSPSLAGLFTRAGVGSHSQQDDSTDGSNRGESNSDTPSSKIHGAGGDGLSSNKSKKKKKTKAFQGISGPRSCEGGMSAGTSVKASDGDSQDLLRYEQMKRKGDIWPNAITTDDVGPGTTADTPGTPGSQGLPGQQLTKKQKSLRQNETNLEATTALVSTSQATQQSPSVLVGNKLMKQNSIRDRNRRVRLNKIPASTTGIGIPWSASEDQAILALVHDLGPNWELVSDVLSSNSQIKGIYRKPKQCKERHKSLIDRMGQDGLENAEDPGSLQPQGSKGNARGSRVHGTPEEDSLKHLEQIVQLVQKYRAQKTPSESQEQKLLATPHPSHGIAISQFCTGGPPNPLELCDQVGNNGDAPHSFPIQPSLGNVLGPPIVPGSGMRPPLGVLPPVSPGTNGLQLGQTPVSSTAAMTAAAARDAQRLTMRYSPEEAARLRMAHGNFTAFNARRLQQQAASVTAGLPVLSGLPNPNDLPMLPTSAAMLTGLSRGYSLPRAGLPGMGPPGVSGMGLPSLGGMLPPGGSLPPANMSRRIANMLNMLRMGPGGCTEEQRMQILQQLQVLAQQGDPQAAAALSTLSGDMAAIVSSPPQPFSPNHQHSIQLQQQQQQQQIQAQQRNQQQQMQLQGFSPQAYAAARMKEQQQRQLQQQQKQRVLGSLPPTPQPQQMLAPPHQPHVPSLPSQHPASQSHILSQQPPKQPTQQQAGGPSSQVPQPASAPSSLQSAPASSAGSSQSNLPPQQMPPPQQAQPVVTQGSGSAKPLQAKQMQKNPQLTLQTVQQQLSARGLKLPNRGAMTIQSLPSQTGQPSTPPGSLNGGSHELPSDTTGPIQSGQKSQVQSGQVQAGKVQSGSQPGLTGASQSQGMQLQGGIQSQGLPSVAPQHKGLQQPQQQHQTAQGGVIKQQQAASSQQQVQPAAQQSGPQPSPNQQSQLPAVPSIQQPQRRQVPQPQPPQRRLQTRHLSPTLGMPMSGQLGKTGMHQTGQGVPPQVASQPSHNPYQVGGTATIGDPLSVTNSNSHSMPLSSGLSSSTSGPHSAQWKSNQTMPPLSGGIYNLTRTNSTGPGQVPGMVSSGLHVPSYNGNIGISSLPSTGIHGVSLGNMPQNLSSMQGAPALHTQKSGISSGMNGRCLPGSQQGIASGQRNQHTSSMPVSVAMGNNTSQMRPPVPPSTIGGLPVSACATTQGGASTGLQPGVSAPMSNSTIMNSGQVRQPHAGHLISSSSSAPVSQRLSTAAASVSISSGSSTPSTTPGPGPLPPVETTPTSSS